LVGLSQSRSTEYYVVVAREPVGPLQGGADDIADPAAGTISPHQVFTLHFTFGLCQQIANTNSDVVTVLLCVEQLGTELEAYAAEGFGVLAQDLLYLVLRNPLGVLGIA